MLEFVQENASYPMETSGRSTHFVIFSSIYDLYLMYFCHSIAAFDPIKASSHRTGIEQKKIDHLIRTVFFLFINSISTLRDVAVIIAGILFPFQCKNGNRQFIVCIVSMSTQFCWLKNMIDYSRPNERPFIYFPDSKKIENGCCVCVGSVDCLSSLFFFFVGI